MSITIKQIIDCIEAKAPLFYQESYDNSGVQVGNIHQEVSSVLTTLDITLAVIDEAIARKCNLIIAHHPLIFSGIKKITGKNEIEQCIIKAIQNNIVLYAAHTNIDNISNGVNKIIAEKLGLQHAKILEPSNNHPLYKLIIYAPTENVEEIKQALFNAGGGYIGNYSECSFSTSGVGSFKAMNNAQPHIGKIGSRILVNEDKIEVIVPQYKVQHCLQNVRNIGFYEEVAHDIIKLDNKDHFIGAGMLGSLLESMHIDEFLRHLKDSMDLQVIKYTKGTEGRKIKTVAVCGGSGSFLLKSAIAQNADIFITADYKYHQFFDHESKITIADIGHYESEKYTYQLFHEWIYKSYPEVPIYNTHIETNPIKYFV